MPLVSKLSEMGNTNGVLRRVLPTHDSVAIGKSTYQDLFRRYRCNDTGKQVLGTKAVVVNLQTVVGETLEEVAAPAKYEDGFNESYESIEQKIVGEAAEEMIRQVNHSMVGEYAGLFWEKTSQYHHKDVMLAVFDSVRQGIENKMVEHSSHLLLDACIAAKEGIGELSTYKRSCGGVNMLSEYAISLLSAAQGYQLSSVQLHDTDDIDDVKVAHKKGHEIHRIQVDSSITNDHRKLGGDKAFLMPRGERKNNLVNFLGRFQNMTIETGVIETPKYYLSERQQYDVTSCQLHEQKSSVQIQYEDMCLDITYA